MTRALIKNLITNDYDSLTFEEIKLIISNPKVFPIKKTDKQALEKLISKPSDENRDTAIKVLRAILPSPFELLKNIDKYSVREEEREFNFRDRLLRNLYQMNHTQLCIFIDKVIKFGKDESLRFFRNREYSLHAINGAISSSLGLSLVFEIFKPGKYQTFKVINYNLIDKAHMISVLDTQIIRYLYILESISNVILTTDEEHLMGTKINKTIRANIADYVKVINSEHRSVHQSGVKKHQTWTYNICNLVDVTVEDDDEFVSDEEEDNE